MDETTEPSGLPLERPLPPLPDPAAEVFLVTDEQRQAAANHLDGEQARGVLDPVEVERRKQAVLVATTVAELLAATAVEPTAATTSSADKPAVRTNVLALMAGLVVGVVLLVTVVPRLF